jgi:hypothetical protein
MSTMFYYVLSLQYKKYLTTTTTEFKMIDTVKKIIMTIQI